MVAQSRLTYVTLSRFDATNISEILPARTTNRYAHAHISSAYAVFIYPLTHHNSSDSNTNPMERTEAHDVLRWWSICFGNFRPVHLFIYQFISFVHLFMFDRPLSLPLPHAMRFVQITKNIANFNSKWIPTNYGKRTILRICLVFLYPEYVLFQRQFVARKMTIWQSARVLGILFLSPFLFLAPRKKSLRLHQCWW